MRVCVCPLRCPDPNRVENSAMFESEDRALIIWWRHRMR
jgi:hypothetical protein